MAPTPERLRNLTEHRSTLISRTLMTKKFSLISGPMWITPVETHLLRNLGGLKSSVGFFIPTVRRCVNKTTQLFSETKDPSLFIIAYGTLSNYIGYEIDELMNSFHYKGNDPLDRDFIFLRPDNINIVFSKAMVESLPPLFNTIRWLVRWSHISIKV